MFHEEAALKLAEAGVHALVEKPLAGDVAAGTAMAEAFEAAGLIGAVGYVERCNPALIEMRRRIQDGQLGDIYQVVTRRQSPFPARISDVGVVKDLATHDVDLAAWIAGSPYRLVFAQTAHRSGRDQEDMVTVSGHFANGVLVSNLKRSRFGSVLFERMDQCRRSMTSRLGIVRFAWFWTDLRMTGR